MEYQSMLLALGLNENEATIYEYLLTHGKQKASDLAIAVEVGRGNTYNILTKLVTLGLVTTIEGAQQLFQAAEPAKLRTLLDAQRSRIDQLQSTFNATLPHLLSAYNLTTGKPAIEIFEGLEGLERALADSLEQKEEILTFLDPLSLSKETSEINMRYVKKRIKKDIKKKIIMPENAASIAYKHGAPQEATEYRIIKNLPPFPSVAVEIYGDSATLLNYKNNKIISVIMHDKAFADFYRRIFYFLWEMPQS